MKSESDILEWVCPACGRPYRTADGSSDQAGLICVAAHGGCGYRGPEEEWIRVSDKLGQQLWEDELWKQHLRSQFYD